MKQIFSAEGIPPKVYQAVLNQQFGTDWINWLPETLYQEIQRIWGVLPSAIVSDKLGALKVFLSTDLFYHQASVFEHVVQAINENPVYTELMNLSTPDEIQYALYVLGPFNNDMFEREIVAYIRTCCDAFGLLVYPKTLDFAQPEYTNPILKEYASKIRPRQMKGAPDDVVVQQSNKLYAVNKAIITRLSEFDPSILEQSSK